MPDTTFQIDVNENPLEKKFPKKLKNKKAAQRNKKLLFSVGVLAVLVVGMVMVYQVGSKRSASSIFASSNKGCAIRELQILDQDLTGYGCFCRSGNDRLKFVCPKGKNCINESDFAKTCENYNNQDSKNAKNQTIKGCNERCTAVGEEGDKECKKYNANLICYNYRCRHFSNPMHPACGQ